MLDFASGPQNISAQVQLQKTTQKLNNMARESIKLLRCCEQRTAHQTPGPMRRRRATAGTSGMRQAPHHSSRGGPFHSVSCTLSSGPPQSREPAPAMLVRTLSCLLILAESASAERAGTLSILCVKYNCRERELDGSSHTKLKA